MKITKKILTYMMVIGALMGVSQQTYGAIYGEVVTQGAVAYCAEQGMISPVLVYEQFEIIDVQEDKDVYLIQQNNQILEINKDYVQVRKILEDITTEGVKVRRAPDPDSEIIHSPQIGEQVSVMYRSGNWYQVILKDGRQGFIYKTQLEDPYLHLLQEKDFSKPKVEVLGWSEASRVVPRGAVVTIEDVYSGKTFKVKRTFGTNHADVEALTKQDTAKMKESWGGFTWERRPVIVHVNGRRLAASLAGMPHAGSSLDAVPNNGMSGVIDLHFRGSKKHKEGSISATVDPLHQKAINVAAQYE